MACKACVEDKLIKIYIVANMEPYIEAINDRIRTVNKIGLCRIAEIMNEKCAECPNE